jgi:hypothetical protein
MDTTGAVCVSAGVANAAAKSGIELACDAKCSASRYIDTAPCRFECCQVTNSLFRDITVATAVRGSCSRLRRLRTWRGRCFACHGL